MNRLLALAAVAGAGLVAVAQTPPAHPAAKHDAPAARFVLGHRSADCKAHKAGLGHTAGGFIEVAQPRPDTVVVTMTGLAAAAGLPCETSAASLAFDLTQDLAVAVNRPDVAAVRVTLSAKLTGLLRASRPGAGTAAIDCPAAVAVTAGGAAVLSAAFEPKSIAGDGTLFVNDHFGPAAAVVPPGPLGLKQTFGLAASHPKKCFHRNAVFAAFGPDAPRPPEWVGIIDPTRDLPKRDVGFQVVLHAEPLLVLPAGK